MTVPSDAAKVIAPFPILSGCLAEYDAILDCPVFVISTAPVDWSTEIPPPPVIDITPEFTRLE